MLRVFPLCLNDKHRHKDKGFYGPQEKFLKIQKLERELIDLVGPPWTHDFLQEQIKRQGLQRYVRKLGITAKKRLNLAKSSGVSKAHQSDIIVIALNAIEEPAPE